MTDQTSNLHATWAESALANLECFYPYCMSHTTESPEDIMLPADRYPAFHCSYDWHSCVHMHWLLVSTLRRHGDEPEVREMAPRIVAAVDNNLTAEKLAAEAEYFKAHQQYERPYGWGWLRVLHAETALLAADEAADAGLREKAAAWERNLVPLKDAIDANLQRWMRNAYGPVRCGFHSNSSYALLLTLWAARAVGDDAMAAEVEETSRAWFGADVAAPVAFEPDALDFLSPALTEAHLMASIMPADEFTAWFSKFIPNSAMDLDARWMHHPVVKDKFDPQQGHLFGLAYDRAWHMRALAEVLAKTNPEAAEKLSTAAAASAAWGDDAVHDLSFIHMHWLATFACLGTEGKFDITAA